MCSGGDKTDLMKVKGMIFVCISYRSWVFMPFNLDCQYHAKLGLCVLILGEKQEDGDPAIG